MSRFTILLAAALLLPGQSSFAQTNLSVGKATETTKKVNKAVLSELDFNDNEDFDLATKGFMGTLTEPIIKEKDVNYDINAQNFTHDKPAPDSVNPSLWRQSQLTSQNGLYQVSENIYQIRGLDISNMTFISGKTGWIVVDPLTSAENAAAGLKLVNEKLGERPIKVVIFTHSHVDHFGGVMGIIKPEDIKSKKVQIVAPEGFLEEAISENLYAGNIMSRRATFSYGTYLPYGPTGTVGTGLGPAVSAGTHTIAIPTTTIKKTGETAELDGVKFVFQMAPGTEAPSEMLFYLPDLKALCLAEDAVSTQHNLYTLRGAKVRSPLVWSNALNTTLEMFGKDAQIAFASHHWPRWGNEKIREFIGSQRDMYKYINDQTLRLANMGYDAEEIAERLKLPDNLNKKFHNRGYYGALKHNVKATYQLYLGFFNGDPATLDKHPRVEAGKRYVQAMGGQNKVLQVARDAFKKGDYRWAAEVVNHLVYANPQNKEALQIKAAALEQMGFQAESGTWRGFYLSAAKELREGKAQFAPSLVDPKTLPLAMLFEYSAIRVNPEKAKNKNVRVGLTTTDTKEAYTLTLNNSVLVVTKPEKGEKLDANAQMASAEVSKIFSGETSVADLKNSGALKGSGNFGVLGDIVATLDTFPNSLNLVTPVDGPKSKLDKNMAEVSERDTQLE
ncbi:alkyl/aryl-sulfatase [Bdellovibrio bacteriovorus]|uniref:alkyl/aryl-sulfatase n=1 Tax=Bdellovibrio bacteriovorus TaxID=959 RepID=UPI0035A60C97